MTLRPSLERFGLFGGEHDFAAGGAGRGRQAGGDHLAFGLGIDGRMQELIERRRIDPRHRLLLRDQNFPGHVDGDAQRGLRGALAIARLQHPQLALLDRELEILHVAVVLLEHARRSASAASKASGIAVSIDGLSEPAPCARPR